MIVPSAEHVLSVRQAPAPVGVLFLLTPRTICAVTGAGLAWESERVAVDDLRIDRVEGGLLMGESDPGSGHEVAFALRLRDGALVSGSPRL